VIKRRISQL